MKRLTLRQKFTIGLVTIVVVSLVLMLGVRLLGKAARFHYLERNHQTLIMQSQASLEIVTRGGSGAEQVLRRPILDAIGAARAIAGSVDQELFGVEIAAFRVMGFGSLIELPKQSFATLESAQRTLTANPSSTVTRDDALAVKDALAHSRELGDRFGPDLEKATHFLQALVLGLDLAGIAVVLTTFLMIRGATLQPLSQALGVARRIADGDLTSPPLPASGDEVGRLNAAIDGMKHGLATVVGEVRERSHAVAGSIAEVADGSGNLSARTEQQASTLQQTVATLEAINESVTQIGRQMREADAQAGDAERVATAGGDAVARAVARMEDILAASRRIADINGVIDGIAFQTNILALNAAVEAARAGEQGRGFAVVASEVRTLAQRSADAAREIATLIGDTTAKVEHGATEVGEAGRTIGDVVQRVQRVTQLVKGVAQELSAQESRFGQMNDAVGQIEAGTQQNAALAEESAAAAMSVRSQAAQLVQTVERFRLSA